ncbi:MAG: tRNA-dihydrouridine synthase family protein [bacterium]|nr:tRNA-dihydrouridine synthase family protein [bacterium]
MKIGNLDIKYNAIPAPLASLTDIVFRKLLDEIGYAGFMVTEMVSAEGLRRHQEKTLDMIRPTDFKTPQFIQLFGSEPDQFVDAVKYIENETEYCGIDINVGCPVPKVVKRGAGSALLKDPCQLASIVRAIKSTTKLPLTVKIRLGFVKENAPEITQMLEEEGADAVAVHFRSRADGYKGEAKWHYAPLIKQGLKKMPFIGNGDVVTAQDAKVKMEYVDAVMIGRGAVANPLIFAEIAGALENPGDDAYRLNMKWVYRRLLELIEEYYPPQARLIRLKAYARFLFSNRRNSKTIRQSIYTSSDFEDAKKQLHSMMLDDYFDSPKEL